MVVYCSCFQFSEIRGNYFYIVAAHMLVKITNTWRAAIVCKIKSEYDCKFERVIFC